MSGPADISSVTILIDGCEMAPINLRNTLPILAVVLVILIGVFALQYLPGRRLRTYLWAGRWHSLRGHDR